MRWRRMCVDLKPIESRHVAGVGYDPETHQLRVAFSTGSQYDYKDVPPEVYEQMLQAPSVGAFHALQIRNKYEFKKVTDEQ